ncbi:MAG: DUF4158 domain-containing protein [Streptosporangiaceae bacterium]
MPREPVLRPGVIPILRTSGDLRRYGSCLVWCVCGGWWDGVSVLSDEQIERLRSFPDIGREELFRHFALTRKDLGFIDKLGRGGGRGPAARLGLAVQLCTLLWLGFVPEDIWSVPQAALIRLSNQVAVFPAAGAVQRGRAAVGLGRTLPRALRAMGPAPGSAA